MSATSAPDAARADRWGPARELAHRWTEPAITGLPRWWVLAWFPALLALLLIILVGLGISGSSTGMFWTIFGSGPDPDLLAGIPRPVRSDEWLTNGSWLVSQWSQDFPATNQVFPGGMDATVLLDLPARDWSTIFRPHVVGFLLFGIDHGLALRWWLPALIMTAAGYCLLATLLPRRPLTCAVLAVALFFSPMLQWLFSPSAFFPIALCFLAIATVLFSLNDQRRWVRISWAAVTAYVAVCTVLTLYPPYIIPAALVAVVICAAAVLGETGGDGLGLRRALGALVPLTIGALLAGGVLLLFLVTKSDTIAAITNTVYPGERVQPTGEVDYRGLVQLFGAPFADGLDSAAPLYAGLLGPNSSEAATPVLLGLFLILPLGWFVIHDWRAARRLNWTMLACAATIALLFAFLLIPGWDAVAHLLLLDRSPPTRIRIGFIPLCIVAIALLVRRLDEGDVPLPWWVTWATATLTAVPIVLVWVALANAQDPALPDSANHRLVAVLFVAGAILYTRGRALPASLTLLTLSMVLSVGVNPLYRGMFDLTETAMGEQVKRIDDARPGSWVGIGSSELNSVLFESAVRSYSGVQFYPSRQMWLEIDPDGRYETEWNRYASVKWEPGSGEPQLRNPQPDIVIGTFDSCSSFAQHHVTYVMADRAVDQACLRQIDRVTEAASTFWFYEVVR